MPGRRRAETLRHRRHRTHPCPDRAAQRPPARPWRCLRCLATLPDCTILRDVDDPGLQHLAAEIGEHPQTLQLLAGRWSKTHLWSRDGGMIAPVTTHSWTNCATLSQNADRFLVELEKRERAHAADRDLKVSYNRVQWLLRRDRRSKTAQAPATISAARRSRVLNVFITPELKSFEDKVLSAHEACSVARKPLRGTAGSADRTAGHTAAHGGGRDCPPRCTRRVCRRARRLDLCRPTFRDAPGLTVSGGRHPVVEQVSDTPFVANDLLMDEQRQI